MSAMTGKDVTIYYYSGAEASLSNANYRLFAHGVAVGFTDEFTYTVDEGTERYFGAGKRLPWGQSAGPKDITITVDGLWIDSGARKFFMDEVERTGSLTTFTLGASGTDRSVVFSGCKIISFDGNFPVGDWLTQSVEIGAKGIE